jgi:hypothetical protein
VLFPYNENRPAYFEHTFSGQDVSGLPVSDLNSFLYQDATYMGPGGGIGLCAPHTIRLRDLGWIFSANVPGDGNAQLDIEVSDDCGDTYTTIASLTVDTSSSFIVPVCETHKLDGLILAGQVWRPQFATIAVASWEIVAYRIVLGCELVAG